MIWSTDAAWCTKLWSIISPRIMCNGNYKPDVRADPRNFRQWPAECEPQTLKASLKLVVLSKDVPQH